VRIDYYQNNNQLMTSTDRLETSDLLLNLSVIDVLLAAYAKTKWKICFSFSRIRINCYLLM